MTKKKGFLYVLHFDESICHARHYLGSTCNLVQRMQSHWLGRGAKLTAELRRRGIGFRIGSLYTLERGMTPRIVERMTKQQKNGPRFCARCSGAEPVRIYGASFVGQESLDAANELLDTLKELWDQCHQDNKAES